MRKRGQGAFEYVLLLAGVILIVVVAILLMRGFFTGGTVQTTVDRSQCMYKLSSAPECFTNGVWAECNQVLEAEYAYGNPSTTNICVSGAVPAGCTTASVDYRFCGPKPG
jgi:uncharacterized protein (UPF0333 family)